jgi:hypothetical protein
MVIASELHAADVQNATFCWCSRPRTSDIVMDDILNK